MTFKIKKGRLTLSKGLSPWQKHLMATYKKMKKEASKFGKEVSLTEAMEEASKTYEK